MKFYTLFFFISFFATVISFAQQKNTVKKQQSTIKYINNNIDISIALYQKYEYKKALKIIEKCISESKQIKHDSLLGRSHIICGIINAYLDKETKALYNLKKAEILFKKSQNYKMLGIAYHNVAFTFERNSNDTDSIIFYYKKAIKNYNHSNNTSKVAYASTKLAKRYISIDKLTEAKAYLTTAIPLAIEHKREKVLTRAYIAYAEYYLKKNNPKKALEYLTLAENLAEKKGYEFELLSIYELKSNNLKKLKKIEQAYSYIKKHKTYLSRTHEIEKYRLSQKVSIKFEVKEKKALLKKSILENELKENKLKTSRRVFFFFLIILLIVTIAVLLLYRNNKLKIENNKLLIVKNKKLKYLQIQTKLKYLKTQIQPDLFFTSLKKLHTLILNKSNKSKEVVLKISGLIQYILYKASKKHTSLIEDVDSIQNYLYLKNLSCENRFLFSFKIKGDISNVMVPPLLYIPFIEAGFKKYETSKVPVKVTIMFKVQSDQNLIFKIKARSNKDNSKTTQDINLEDLSRRLKLLYRNTYKLKKITRKNGCTLYLKTPLHLKNNVS